MLQMRSPSAIFTLGVFSIVVAARSAAGALAPAAELTATAQSSSSIALAWKDPNSGEVGFHVQRSTDGAAFSTIENVGPSVAAYVDSGRPPATLFYYRIVAFDFGGDAAPSNVAAASTHPAAAVKTCATQLSTYRTMARHPSVARGDGTWAMAWSERRDGELEEIWFQLLDHTTGAPSGAPVRVTTTDAPSQYPALRWNGSHFGVVWGESMRGEGGANGSGTYFALLDASGNKLAGDVRIVGAPPNGYLNGNLDTAFVSNGSGWGVFLPLRTTDPSDLVYYRLDEKGKLLVAGKPVAASPDWELEVSAAWNGAEYGVAWTRSRDTASQVLFQRVSLDGTPLGTPALLATNPAGGQTFQTSVAPDGAGWAVAWVEAHPDGAEWIFLARLDGVGNLIGSPQRISDEWDARYPPGQTFVSDEQPQLFRKPDGGFLVFTSSILRNNNRYQLCRLEADASGAKAGTRSILTPADNRHRSYGKAATDGSSYLVGYNDTANLTQEVASLPLDAGGAPAGPPVAVTSGHAPGNGSSWQTASLPKTLPLGAGFVTLWLDRTSSITVQLQAAIVDGAGAIVKKTLTTENVPRYAAVSVGSTFAVAVPSGSTLNLKRFDASGNPVGSPTLVSGSILDVWVGIDFSGEAYGIVWTEPNAEELGRVWFQRFRPDGTPLGAKVALGTEMPGFEQNLPYVQWTGKGWAILWDVYDSAGHDDLWYGFVDTAGALTIPGIQVTFTEYPPQPYAFVWSGHELGVVRSEERPENPPGKPLYYFPLGLDGFKTAPEKMVATGDLSSLSNASLTWKGDRFALTYQLDNPDSIRQIELLPNGDALPGVRTLTNRGGQSSVAWNGVTLGVSWLQLREIFFETDACLADATRPPCPAPQASFDGHRVTLGWDAVADGESGLYRYTIYRDGVQRGEVGPAALAFEDAGMPAGLCAYEVRALNGAFRESEGCAPVAVSALIGDANADGKLDVSDVFYLINDLFAGGSAPKGWADVNADSKVDVTDVFYLINHLFAGGPPPLGHLH